MKKFLCISVSYLNIKRGAFLVSERMVNEHISFIDHSETKDIKSIDHLHELNEQYLRIIFITQVQANYSFPINLITLKDINYLIYTREYYSYFGDNTCNNGFYYSYPTKIKNYIPLITDFKVSRSKKFKRPCLGFYIRNYLTPDSYSYFIEMLSNIKQDIDVYTMGHTDTPLTRFNCVVNHYHTYDNIEFFENITHYIYPRSKIFHDPLPHSLIEAIQNNIQIIVPTIKGRDHKDGIDDIIEVSRYHTIYNEDLYLDNTDTIFKSVVFKNFYKNLFENNFNHFLDRDKYKTYSEWLNGEVL